MVIEYANLFYSPCPLYIQTAKVEHANVQNYSPIDESARLSILNKNPCNPKSGPHTERQDAMGPNNHPSRQPQHQLRKVPHKLLKPIWSKKRYENHEQLSGGTVRNHTVQPRDTKLHTIEFGQVRVGFGDMIVREAEEATTFSVFPAQVEGLDYKVASKIAFRKR